MKRVPVYSARGTLATSAGHGGTHSPEDDDTDAPQGPPLLKRLAAFYRRREPLVLFFLSLLITGGAASIYLSKQTPAKEYSQEDIDAAVLHTVESKTLPSRAAKAAELIRQSVVRVNGFEDDYDKKDADSATTSPFDPRGRADPADPRAGNSKDGAGAGARAGKDGAGKDGGGGAGRADAGKDGSPGGTGAPNAQAGKDNNAQAKDPLPKNGGNAKLPRDPEGPNHAKAGKEVPSKDAKPDGKDPNDKQVRKSDDPNHPEEEKRHGRVGTGVVIVDSGIILTNLHVVAGAKRLTVTFYDGMESEAELIAAQPENDLAVIKAKRLPDDLPAATLGSSMRLQPGDEVVAVGFPFGIGPSVSAGVVSGLNRGFRSGDGKRQLSRLIQFDAAVNPGNSGGPLITMDGEVVGIVTAIFNPTESRTFIGIGFAATIESAGAAVGIPPF